MTSNHNCIHQDDIKSLTEDVATIKTALGYKEKTNGDFKKEVENENKTLTGRIASIELQNAEIKGKLDVLVRLMVPLLVAVIGAIILSMYRTGAIGL